MTIFRAFIRTPRFFRAVTIRSLDSTIVLFAKPIKTISGIPDVAEISTVTGMAFEPRVATE